MGLPNTQPRDEIILNNHVNNYNFERESLVNQNLNSNYIPSEISNNSPNEENILE